MYDDDLRRAALLLVAVGMNDSQVSRRLGIPRTTVRDWRRPRPEPARCRRCWRAMRPVRFEPADYAELLGLYLGDGHICSLPRTQRLRLFLDARYPDVVRQTGELISRCFPGNRVGRLTRHDGAMVVLWVYHSHLSCLFPQAGAGKKHDRAIILEPWQESLFRAAPWAFIKGCIRSDGCVFVNRTGNYEYLSYDFANLSADIRDLFMRACTMVGVECRLNGTRVRIYRRTSAALMLEHVGLKR